MFGRIIKPILTILPWPFRDLSWESCSSLTARRKCLVGSGVTDSAEPWASSLTDWESRLPLHFWPSVRSFLAVSD